MREIKKIVVEGGVDGFQGVAMQLLSSCGCCCCFFSILLGGFSLGQANNVLVHAYGGFYLSFSLSKWNFNQL